MAFHDPLTRYEEINDENALKPNISRFLSLEGKPQPFYDAIKELEKAREGLLIADKGGLLDQGLRQALTFYKGAVLWLKLNTPINQGIAVSAIASLDDINDPLASSFLQYVQWLKSNYLDNQRVYQDIQIQLGKEKVDRLKTLELREEELLGQFAESLKYEQKKLNETSDTKKSQINKELTDSHQKQLAEIIEASKKGVGEIKQAQALSIWHEAYQEDIERYELKLYGKNWSEVLMPSHILGVRETYIEGVFEGLKVDYENWLSKLLNKVIDAAKKLVVAAFWLLSLLVRVVLFLVKKVQSANSQRTLWFISLAFVLVGQSFILLWLLVNGDVQDFPLGDLLGQEGIEKLRSNDFIFIKLSIFLGLILIPSLGYASANKNYRIYSNLIEQFRHRNTVAETLQGILRYIDEGENNKDIRVSLATVAATAMFEMKTVGHLTKKDGDTLPLAEILQSVMNK